MRPNGPAHFPVIIANQKVSAPRASGKIWGDFSGASRHPATESFGPSGLRDGAEGGKGVLHRRPTGIFFFAPATLWVYDSAMPCVLRAYGKRFDVERFCSRTSLPVCAVSIKGEPRFTSKPRGRKRLRSGFSVDVSDADFGRLKKQIADAVRFLRRYRREILRLRRFPGVELMSLDFGIEQTEAYVFSENIPAQLAKLAGELGLDIEFDALSGDKSSQRRDRQDRCVGGGQYRAEKVSARWASGAGGGSRTGA